MKTISLRGIDETLAQQLKDAAQHSKLSVNQYIPNQLRESLGLNKPKHFTKKHHDLDDLFGR